MLNKSQIYIKVDTPEKCTRLIKLFIDTDQDVYDKTFHYLTLGSLGQFCNVHFNNIYWIGFIGEIDKTEVTLSDLEDILNGRESTPNTSEVIKIINDWREWEDCILSFLRSHKGLRDNFNAHVDEWNEAIKKLPPGAYDIERDQKIEQFKLTRK